MKKIILCIFCIYILSACSNTTNSKTTSANIKQKEEQEIKNFIKQNLTLTEKEDIDGVMSQVDCNSINCNDQRTAMKFLFDTYDIEYKLNKIQIVKMTKSSAKVIVVQTTKKVKGPQFKDNKGEFIHTLIKVDNKWKFKNSDIKKVEYLN